jgi:hypothetical protein
MIAALFLAAWCGAALGWCVCAALSRGAHEDAYRIGRLHQVAADAAARLEAEQRARRDQLRGALYRRVPKMQHSPLCQLRDLPTVDQRAIIDAIHGDAE